MKKVIDHILTSVMLIQLPAISPGAGGTSANYPPGTMLLKVRLRNGNISYQNGDVLERKDRWQPSDWQKAVLLQEYRSTAEVIVQFVSSANGGVDYGPVPVKRASGCCNRLEESSTSCEPLISEAF